MNKTIENETKRFKEFSKTQQGKDILKGFAIGVMVGIILKFILIGIAVMVVAYLIYTGYQNKKDNHPTR